MFETVADFRRKAEAIEADLTLRTGEVAALIDPPFTLQKRRRIKRLLAGIEAQCAVLHRIWTAQMMTAEARALPFGHPDRVYFLGVNGRLQIWSETPATLASALSGRAVPLTSEEPPEGSPVHGQLLAYQRCFDRLHGYFSPTPPQLYSPEIGRHGDVPYPFTGFFRLMQVVRRLVLAQGRPSAAFLDVGCGVGLKLLQAAEFFDVVHGFEFDPDRAAAAQQLVDRSRRMNDRGFRADALQFDGYGNYDVIYAYKPLSDPELLQQMERRILEQVKPGTMLILPYFEFEFRFEELGCTRIYDKVYLTGGAGQDVAPLLERAGQIGTVVARPDDRRAGVEGFCAPVRDALRHWGHLA